MPKNKFGGCKAKKQKNKKVDEEPEQIQLANGKSLYGQVTKTLGESRMEIFCNDNVKRPGTIPGSMRKKEWIYIGDIVLVELRECDTDKRVCDIIHKYSKNEIRYLSSLGLLKFVEKEEDTKDFIFDGEDKKDFEIKDI